MSRIRFRLLVAVAVLGLTSALLASGPAPAAAAEDDPTIMLVVDTSGSMAGQRLVDAKTALTTSVAALGTAQAAGLRSYGGACGDGGRLRVPIGTGNREALDADIDALAAGGGTPTPEALVAGAADLDGVDGPRAIVLISDGQSTCGDPCPVAADIAEDQGIEFKVHTVGYQAPAAAAGELACIAQVTGGQYFAVDDAEGLAGAIGDVIGGSGDRDGDGLLDVWETDGYDHDGDGTVDVDLPAMGADPDVRDVFVEVDWMQEDGRCYFGWCGSPHHHRLTQSQVDRAVATFANAPGEPVRLHVDAGPDIRRTDGSPWGDLSGATPLSEVSPFLAGGWSDLDAVKAASFDEARGPIFHYAVMAHDIPGGYSGRSRGIPGADLVVSLGDPRDDNDVEVVGTFLHELGHNLGLRHGGGDHAPWKPNYRSVMNYAFQLAGIPEGGRMSRVDYSREALAALDEWSLGELVGVERETSHRCAADRKADLPPSLQDAHTRIAGGWAVVHNLDTAPGIDWDCSGDLVFHVPVRADVDGSGSDEDILTGFDDWANLDLAGGIAGAGAPTEDDADEIPRDALPVDTLDNLALTGPAVVTVDELGPLPTLRYTVTNTVGDPDEITVTVAGSAASTATATHDLDPGESVEVAVPVTGPGAVEVVAASGDNPQVTASMRTQVAEEDLTALDPATLLGLVAERLRADADVEPRPGADHLRSSADAIDAALVALGGDRPTWDAKVATARLKRGVARLDGSFDAPAVADDALLARGIVAAAAQRIATDALTHAEAHGGAAAWLDRGTEDLGAAEGARSSGAWFEAVDAARRAGSHAYGAHRT